MTDTGLAIDFNDSVVFGHIDPHDTVESRKIRDLRRELEEAEDQIEKLVEKIAELEKSKAKLYTSVEYFHQRAMIYEIRMKLQHGRWNKWFELPWEASMSRLFAAYREKRLIPVTTRLKFMWRGYELKRKDTARALLMPYDDRIEVEHVDE